MNIQLTSKGEAAEPATRVFTLTCPICRHHVVLTHISAIKDHYALSSDRNRIFRFGQRLCPNDDCRALIFIVADNKSGEILETYPPERIDFDATDIPAKVLASLEEAIACHSQRCYVASAIMIRKTLEDLCQDQGAEGKNLKERIEALSKGLNLSKAFLDALHDIRLLGNDAAHVELNEFNGIGDEEVKIGIDCTKEILKATYQMTTLLGRLKAFKKNKETDTSS